MSFSFCFLSCDACLISLTLIECLHCLRTWNRPVGCYSQMPLPPSLTTMKLTLRGIITTTAGVHPQQPMPMTSITSGWSSGCSANLANWVLLQQGPCAWSSCMLFFAKFLQKFHFWHTETRQEKKRKCTSIDTHDIEVDTYCDLWRKKTHVNWHARNWNDTYY